MPAALCALLLAALPATGALVAAEMRSLDDAVYARQQARSGKKLYEQYCSSCHERGYFRQVLRAREGEPLSELFNVMVALMPQNAPGSLTDGEYVDVIAYIVADARYAPGRRRLRYADLPSILIGGE